MCGGGGGGSGRGGGGGGGGGGSRRIQHNRITAQYIYVLCCNFNQSIGKCLCPHTYTIKIVYSVFYSVGKHGKRTLASSGVSVF